MFLPLALAATLASAVPAERDEPRSPSHIVGGQDVAGEFEFTVKVWTRTDPVKNWGTSCTGTLIHESWVITAGHCLEFDPAVEDIYVCLKPERCASWEWKRASRYFIRPGYEGSDEDGTIPWAQVELDQALVQLRYPAQDIDPPAIISPRYSSSESVPGLRIAGALVGWGYTRWDPDLEESRRVRADTLQKSPVWIEEAPWQDGVLNYTLPNSRGQYTAPGDSGGSVVLWTILGWTLVGINSSGDYEARRASGGAITRDLFRWIDRTLGDWGDSVKAWTPPPVSSTPPGRPDPPTSRVNEAAAEGRANLRMIGSEEGSRSAPHSGVLLHVTGESYGLFGVDAEMQYEPTIRLLHSRPINFRSATIHMKADSRWVPHLVISEKNQPAEGFEDSGLDYSTTVDLTGSDFEDFLRTRNQIELHIHFAGDTRRTILTFPLRVPIQ